MHARDPEFDGTPAGFANYKGQRAVVEYLIQFARIREAVEYGGLDRLRTFWRRFCVNTAARPFGRRSLTCRGRRSWLTR